MVGACSGCSVDGNGLDDVKGKAMSELIEQLLILVRANLNTSQRAMLAAQLLDAKTQTQKFIFIVRALKIAAKAKDQRVRK